MSKYNVLLSDVFKDFMNSDNVTAKQRVIIDSKIEILSKLGDDWHNVYELKNTYKLFRLEYSRFRIIFFFGNGNDLVITNAFIEKDKKDYKKAIDIANKIKGEYYNV